MKGHIIKKPIACNDEYRKFIEYANENNLLVKYNDEKYWLEEYPEPTKEEILEELRMRRELECFLIINRGKLWYNKLSEAQIVELGKWYQAWLDVTRTQVLPKKPKWLV